MHKQEGQAVLTVMIVMMIVQIIPVALLWRANFEQRLAGASIRDRNALYLAEAGLQKALWIRENEHVQGPSGWTLPHEEALGAGTFTIEAIDSLQGDLISVIVRGECAGSTRRIKALARIGSPALAYGVFSPGIVSFRGRAQTDLLALHIDRGIWRRAGDLAAGVQIRFDSPHATLNGSSDLPPAPHGGEFAGRPLLSFAAPSAAPDPIDLILLGRAQLIGPTQRTVDLDELRLQMRGLGVRRVTTQSALRAPAVDLDHYLTLATANTSNAALNSEAGRASGNPGLWGKDDSRYSADEFKAIVDYLKDRQSDTLRGLVVVEGDVQLDRGARLTITDGALVTQGDITIAEGARLEIRHGPTARALPGMVAWADGSIGIEQGATAMIDGLVLASWDVLDQGGVLEVTGAVAARNFFNENGTVVVRYDSAVLATVGLQRRTPTGTAELVSWHEMR